MLRDNFHPASLVIAAAPPGVARPTTANGAAANTANMTADLSPESLTMAGNLMLAQAQSCFAAHYERRSSGAADLPRSASKLSVLSKLHQQAAALYARADCGSGSVQSAAPLPTRPRIEQN